MTKEYRELFSRLAAVGPREGLSSKILEVIEYRRKRKIFIKKGLVGIPAFLSLISLYPAVAYLSSELSGSGFLYYMSLVFSDGAIILASWQDFLFSLVESLPILSIIVALIPVVILATSLKAMLSQVRFGKRMVLAAQ